MVSSTEGSPVKTGCEAAREGGVLLDVLAVLVEGGGADAAELAAGEGRLEHVGRVHRAFGGAGADEGVELVDEEDDLTFGGFDLGEHGLEALLELAAELRASDHGAEIEGEQALVLEALGDVALSDALGDALDDGGLTDAGLADEHGVVLGAAREHLHHAADLFVAADDRVDLAGARGGGEIAGVLVEGLKLPLGVGVGDALSAADLLERAEEGVLGHASAAEDLRELRVLHGGEEDVLPRGVLVLEVLGLAPRVGEERFHLPRERRLGAAFDVGQALHDRLDLAREGAGVGARFLHDRHRHPALLIEEGEEHVRRDELGVLARSRVALRRHQGFTGLGGESVESHGSKAKHRIRPRHPFDGSSDARYHRGMRAAKSVVIVALLAVIAACDSTPRDVRFDTPEATIHTLLGSFGVADMTQEEVQRHMRSRGSFELQDEATYHACFSDWEGPHSEALAGYVFGTVAAGKDQLRIARVGDRVHVYPDPDRREAYVVMEDSDAGYRISLHDSVPPDVRRALLAEHERIANRQRRIGASYD